MKRHPNSPVITPSLSARIGENINGPSVVEAPDWLPDRRGRYYLYFASHGGQFIRLAVADAIAGPYRIYEPGVLHIRDTPFRSHIASPDVHVDHDRRCLWMHYHGHPIPGSPWSQPTCYAESRDGLTFRSDALPVGPSYLRTFRLGALHYGLAGGVERRWHRSPDPRARFEEGPPLEIAGEAFTPSAQIRGGARTGVYRMRHVALWRDGDRLWVYYSNVGDAPERIKRTAVDLSGDWSAWRGARFEEVLAPERPWEGADLPLSPSRSGAAPGRVRELRDPYVIETAGRRWLFHTVAGESGLAVAEEAPPPGMAESS
jgi:hypothetical protein